MENLILAKKEIGETPLDVIKTFKQNNTEYENVRMGYAGRLDPLARGLLILLVGDECKNRDHYQNLSKTYEFQILFGVSTDTFDPMGKLVDVKFPEKLNKDDILEVVQSFTKDYEQSYPIYSSYHIDGKPLWWWAKNNKMKEVENKIPKKKVSIYELKVLKFEETSLEELSSNFINDINKVNGDFRQAEIINEWQNLSNKNQNQKVFTAKISVKVSSGTYVRVMAHDIGKLLDESSLCFDINRIGIGDYSLQ